MPLNSLEMRRSAATDLEASSQIFKKCHLQGPGTSGREEQQYTRALRDCELVDCRGLRDPQLDPALHRHLGTHHVNAAANLGQKGFAVIEDLCQALSSFFAWP